MVVKDNALINASYTLTLAEQRMILLAIVEAREKGMTIDTRTPLAIHAEAYANQFNVTKDAAYKVLTEAATQLKAREFSFQEQRAVGIANITSRWVQQVAYLETTATVEILFTAALVPLITELERHFTSYELEQVSGLTSGYAVRLYEMIIAWRSVGKTPAFELAQFRWQLGVQLDEYKRMDNFKAKVLDFAIAQINEHTDITATYEQHKRGRTITGFSFNFVPKKKTPAQQAKQALEEARDPNTVDMLSGKTDTEASGKRQREIISKSTAEGMARAGETWQELYKRLSSDYVIKG